ncbi:hypothetical protein HanRHA438_Chr02g0065321 [Helianthus annuus]|nr:hypothetical protein HanRHA438_Chr02g0065321 [Helianthus annuus]
MNSHQHYVDVFFFQNSHVFQVIKGGCARGLTYARGCRYVLFSLNKVVTFKTICYHVL